jgi:prepilin-type N-terminal cleavage/methylation domain-containing protein
MVPVLKKIRAKFSKGFTIVELIVVLAIFGFVSSIILFNYSGFSTNITIQDLSQQIALELRKAQVYALGTHTLTGGGFPKGYGVYFDLSDPKHFTLFADINGNRQYDSIGQCGSAGAECVETFSINTGDKIEKICTQNNTICGSQKTHIAFSRPNPDAHIVTDTTPFGTEEPNVDVFIVSAKGTEKDITVWATGQISVK